MPMTYRLVPVALYQGASALGSRSRRPISASCASQQQRHRDAGVHRMPQRSSSAMTTTCGTAMTTQATSAARVDAQPHRQRADAGAPVALDRLEVVQGHDAVRADAVERRPSQ